MSGKKLAATAPQVSSHNNLNQPASEIFSLDSNSDAPPAFALESEQANNVIEPVITQNELLFLDDNDDDPIFEKQLTLDEFGEPIYYLLIEKFQGNKLDKQSIKFQKAHNILECLEKKGIHISYQCRAGYCGSCRTEIAEGEVAYIQEPLAWINDNEILPCCCVPKTMLKLKL